MIYLLDTHYLIWALTDTAKISKSITAIITNPNNRIMVSAISFWEIALKTSIGKMQLIGVSPENFPNACLQIGFEIIDLQAEDTSTYHQLKATYHRDPFDRMLIWQAIRKGYTLISVDGNISKYQSEGLNVL